MWGYQILFQVPGYYFFIFYLWFLYFWFLLVTDIDIVHSNISAHDIKISVHQNNILYFYNFFLVPFKYVDNF